MFRHKTQLTSCDFSKTQLFLYYIVSQLVTYMHTAHCYSQKYTYSDSQVEKKSFPGVPEDCMAYFLVGLATTSRLQIHLSPYRYSYINKVNNSCSCMHHCSHSLYTQQALKQLEAVFMISTNMAFNLVISDLSVCRGDFEVQKVECQL